MIKIPSTIELPLLLQIPTMNILTGAAGLVSATAILYLVRKNILYSRYTPWWIFISVIFLVFGFFPRLSDYLARMVGVAYGPSLVMLGAVVMLFLKTLLMDIDRSRQEVRLRRLVQRVAMLQSELDKSNTENELLQKRMADNPGSENTETESGDRESGIAS